MSVFLSVKVNIIEFIVECIMHACSGPISVGYDSLKLHVSRLTDPFMTFDYLEVIDKNNLMRDVLIDFLLKDLVSTGVILQHPRTGRYIGNKNNNRFKTFMEVITDIQSPYYFYDEQNLVRIETLVHAGVNLSSTSELEEGGTYFAVWGARRYKVQVQEILEGKTHFIGQMKDKVMRPFQIIGPQTSSDLKAQGDGRKKKLPGKRKKQNPGSEE